MKLSPYLTFDGDARDAITFYSDTFGSEVLMMQTFGEMPAQDWVHEGNRDRLGPCADRHRQRTVDGL